MLPVLQAPAVRARSLQTFQFEVFPPPVEPSRAGAGAAVQSPTSVEPGEPAAGHKTHRLS